MNEFIRLGSAGLLITTRCTLQCKLCGGYIPYLEKHEHSSYERLCQTLDELFRVADFADDLCLTGGEPLLHPDLCRIFVKVLEYSDQIGRILLLTNGTIIPKPEVLTLLSEHRDKCQVTISHYGQHSKKADELINCLNKNDIPVRVIQYYGEDVFCGGWVDYNDHSLKHFTPEDIEKSASACARNIPQVCIWDGEVYHCGRSMERVRIGVIPKEKSECVDLLDNKIPLMDKRKKLKESIELNYLTSCAHCVGLSADVPRHPPAEQL